MFYVFNKDRISAYVVAISTVTILFTIGYFSTIENKKIIDVSANVSYLNSDNNLRENHINLEE